MAISIEQARANLEASIPLIPERYRKGVQGADWATAAGSDQAETNYAAGVTRAITQKLRQAKIREVGNATWQQRSMTKGASSIAAGIQAGLQKYTQNFGRVYAAFQSSLATLPPKTTDPMQNIDTRLKPVVRAWRIAAGKE